MVNFISKSASSADKGYALAKSKTITTKLHDAIYVALLKAGLPTDTADKHASFGIELYDYIEKHPPLSIAFDIYVAVQGVKTHQAASVQVERTVTIAAKESNLRWTMEGAEGAGGAISAFVDYFQGFAKSL